MFILIMMGLFLIVAVMKLAQHIDEEVNLLKGGKMPYLALVQCGCYDALSDDGKTPYIVYGETIHEARDALVETLEIDEVFLSIHEITCTIDTPYWVYSQMKDEIEEVTRPKNDNIYPGI